MHSLQQIWVTIKTIVHYHGDGGTVSSAGVLLCVKVCVVMIPRLSSFPRLCDSALCSPPFGGLCPLSPGCACLD